ncbi:Sugar (pentulose or hexulose) kinase [Palleronia salina]|uniref:Sugar (Pentulose or hexulose) kinase n=1 Tax=Palleronia salina TaxID=313368 RepID=A0A1M6JS01_9RHOB|nr:FGGY-family carbohydrate kinase [Palleronia salina]SHJ49412.1 Sugar (pentulose or hexulose) kinase [Palleronia salina]
MTRPRRIAVIDIGKTNAKLALVDGETLAEISVRTRPNAVVHAPPWPQFDLEGHWTFLLDGLATMQAEHGIDAVSVTTHGASAVLLDADGALAAPMLDYEHDGPDSVASAYDAIRPDFAETGSPRLSMGLNLGAQLHWMFQADPGLRDRVAHVLTYPQYWGYRLTGEMACDVSSLGCHTDLWNPWDGVPSSLVARLGLSDKLAPPRKPSEVLGGLADEIAARTGIAAGTPVAVGIHDSNASLFPHLVGRAAPFSVVSTGTWVIAMAVGGAPGAMEAARDTLVNVDARGGPVPSARFMGGREYEIAREGCAATPTADDRAAVLRGLFLLPSLEPGSGPFPERTGGFSDPPATDGQRMLAISWYLALMTDTCLELVGAAGPTVVEGPFARNADYLQMLAALRPDGVEASGSATGTATGAAMLFDDSARAADGAPVPVEDAEALRAYADAWRARLAAD